MANIEEQHEFVSPHDMARVNMQLKQTESMQMPYQPTKKNYEKKRHGQQNLNEA